MSQYTCIVGNLKRTLLNNALLDVIPLIFFELVDGRFELLIILCISR